MKIKMCSNCRAETTHESTPVKHPMSGDATMETCVECGFETLNVHVEVPPHDLQNGVLVINNPTRIAVNGKLVEVESPLTIRVGNVAVVTMA